LPSQTRSRSRSAACRARLAQPPPPGSRAAPQCAAHRRGVLAPNLINLTHWAKTPMLQNSSIRNLGDPRYVQRECEKNARDFFRATSLRSRSHPVGNRSSPMRSAVSGPAVSAARLDTANDFCATSPPTGSNTASQPLTALLPEACRQATALQQQRLLAPLQLRPPNVFCFLRTGPLLTSR
jgi:hypothetical protein